MAKIFRGNEENLSKTFSYVSAKEAKNLNPFQKKERRI